MAATEVWQRGPLPDVDPYLMPVAHSFLQVREDLDGIDARGSRRRSRRSSGRRSAARTLIDDAQAALDRALRQVRETPGDTLLLPRKVALILGGGDGVSR